MSSISFPRMHASLYVSKLDQSLKFYRKFFGTEPSKEKPGYAKFELAEPPLIISFIEKPDRVQSNFGHLGFQVETEQLLTEYRDRAQASDLIDREEIGTACCYATQDKFWAVDPDGIQWEVYYFHEDAEFNDPKYQLGTAESKPEKAKLSLAGLGAAAPVAEGACCEPGSDCC